MISFGVGVVIPAAGSGERFGGSTPKQYYKILGKPLFLYAVDRFASFPWVKKIALVVDNIDKVNAILQETGFSHIQKIKLVKGESTRHRSIRAGLQELEKLSIEDLKVVVVHDGVRPLIPTSLVIQLCDAANVHGAAGAVRPLISTVLSTSADQFLDASLDRSTHVASETPQAFQFSVLTSAYCKCTQDELDHGTECLQLVLRHMGIRAKLITGPEDLWKITLKKDLYTAVSCIREINNDVCIISSEETSAVKMLEENLISKVAVVKRVVGVLDSSQYHDNKQKTFNTVILFHMHEINQDEQLLDFAALLNTEKQGLIIHIIDNAKIDGMQSMSVYNLHRSGRTMAHHYEKLHKGVVVIHCVNANEDQQLVDLVITLIQADPTTFTGQTFFFF
ncbi:D-ribitol-5-phosphate cytidylyltransferase-like [Lycorma delicatula]|uniref:D-ribitol-5-phosphate cytidylyltransferase-like n=1 Tax=Lycorma delicatula TaxID=130591 RepID=UPI003F515C72